MITMVEDMLIWVGIGRKDGYIVLIYFVLWFYLFDMTTVLILSWVQSDLLSVGHFRIDVSGKVAT